MYNLNYISVDEIINESEHLLSSYLQAGIVSTDFLYPILQRCLASIGATILPTKQEILKIDNFGCALPDDYYSLILLMGSHAWATYRIPPQAQVTYETNNIPTGIRSDFNIDIPIAFNNPLGIENPTFATNEFGRYSIVQRVNAEIYYQAELRTLTLGTNINNCYNPFNKNDYDVEIKNKRIHTNFKDGVLFMEYRAMNQDEVLVPDIPQFFEWLKMEATYNILQYLSLNTTTEVIQKIQYLEPKLHVAKQNAANVWRQLRLEDYKDLKKYLQHNFIKTSRMSVKNTHRKYDKIIDIHRSR